MLILIIKLPLLVRAIRSGSKGMSGACFLAAKAAYRMGCGLVKIATAEIWQEN